MFLYLQHPQKPLAAAAHSLFCAVLKHTDQVLYNNSDAALVFVTSNLSRLS